MGHRVPVDAKENVTWRIAAGAGLSTHKYGGVYPTIIFCAAKLSLDDQERTRVFILSPETSAEKLEESLRLAVARVGDRDAFKQWLESHPQETFMTGSDRRSPDSVGK